MKDHLDTFRSYVHELGEKLKIENLDLDEENNCYLSFDGKYFVKCSLDIEKDQINFLAYIGVLPEDRAVYYQGLLESNYFWKDTSGANLSLDPEDGTLLLTQYCDMSMLDGPLFYNTLEKFVNAMEHWDKKRFEEWSNATGEESESVNDGMAMGFSGSSMMTFGA